MEESMSFLCIALGLVGIVAVLWWASCDHEDFGDSNEEKSEGFFAFAKALWQIHGGN